ncbi:MAG: polyphosphate kinase 2 family protein [Pseudomonadota bacterium]|nr:polyphosphate kinase 2 family protein [Pseudomonadota bacterium]
MKIDASTLRVTPDEKLSLADRPTEVDPLYKSKDDYRDTLESHAKALETHHERLYAAGRHALLVILQGMDTAGKDGAIKHVMIGVNPQGCHVASFKQPTPTESRHDFLWRAQPHLPERGAIAVFNRSYYESVLVERVHPQFLAAQGLAPPPDLDAFFAARLRAIRDYERRLVENGTAIVKIFLHISRDEQKKRLLARLDDPEKNWKASMNDVVERGFWKDYQRAYEQALPASSVAAAPWFVVPANDKKNARLFVSHILIEALDALPMETPKPDAARKKELKAIRDKLD